MQISRREHKLCSFQTKKAHSCTERKISPTDMTMASTSRGNPFKFSLESAKHDRHTSEAINKKYDATKAKCLGLDVPDSFDEPGYSSVPGVMSIYGPDDLFQEFCFDDLCGSNKTTSSGDVNAPVSKPLPSLWERLTFPKKLHVSDRVLMGVIAGAHAKDTQFEGGLVSTSMNVNNHFIDYLFDHIDEYPPERRKQLMAMGAKLREFQEKIKETERQAKELRSLHKSAAEALKKPNWKLYKLFPPSTCWDTYTHHLAVKPKDYYKAFIDNCMQKVQDLKINDWLVWDSGYSGDSIPGHSILLKITKSNSKTFQVRIINTSNIISRNYFGSTKKHPVAEKVYSEHGLQSLLSDIFLLKLIPSDEYLEKTFDQFFFENFRIPYVPDHYFTVLDQHVSVPFLKPHLKWLEPGFPKPPDPPYKLFKLIAGKEYNR